jgi:carboxypeptidase Taq
MNTAENIYQEYLKLMRQFADLKYAGAVLQWDQETYLPSKGNERRGQQMATLSEMAHHLFTSEKTGSLLNRLSENKDLLNDNQRRNIELTLEDYNRSRKLPSGFVREQTEAINHSFHAWIQARKDNNFKGFAEPLQKTIDLKKQEADLLGYEGHPYDALMNEYDRGLTVAFTDQLFQSLQVRLSPILDYVRSRPQADNNFLVKFYDKEKQWAFGLELLKKLHFDFEAGRQDKSEHPFTTNFSARDVRVTTRIDENDFGNMTWSCIHECGHALYEQGLPDEQYGLPLGEYCSLSIHESQSRLWENCIGRGRNFWLGNWDLLMKYFSEEMNGVTQQDFYRGINKVSPSLIRTEADELTYHFHVIIRYEIEKKLIEGSIQATDIPEIWNQMYMHYLGITVPDDKRGCLQDVHWSHGSFGYFATYSIGSLYAAQIWHKINVESPITGTQLAAGDSHLIHEWLKKNIYPFGRFYSSADLCFRATGEILNPDYFIIYAKNKFKEIYG